MFRVQNHCNRNPSSTDHCQDVQVNSYRYQISLHRLIDSPEEAPMRGNVIKSIYDIRTSHIGDVEEGQ